MHSQLILSQHLVPGSWDVFGGHSQTYGVVSLSHDAKTADAMIAAATLTNPAAAIAFAVFRFLPGFIAFFAI
jgi:hypothetical protein